ncbi:MAG: type II toxin-antitoxin system VapB family antitoxin [Propionibacteriaceae bacterium]|jgi:Arc/MetJ family transcription regulator|nr:type II toxin-antitoxin system VapB family antitoxin [Propionibacteriaceae bacterium]
MAVTTVDLDSALIDAAKLATGEKTVKGAVTAALKRVVELNAQKEAVLAMGKMDFLSDWLDPNVRAKAEG